VSAGPRVLIVGCTGQIGTELQRAFAGHALVAAADRRMLDLSNEQQIREVVRRVEPEAIINAAAYTAVDRAESEEELAAAINARAPGILAEEARRAGALFVHYSTDYVFDGSSRRPWTENDIPHPLGVYGATKLAGEESIREVGGRYLIFRTSWIYGPHGKNFLLTMLRPGRERESVSVVDDQFGAPTTSSEVARATYAIIDGVQSGRFGRAEDWAGTYHMTCSGWTTWYGFAQAIFERAAPLLGGRRPAVAPISSSEYPTPAKRPRYSVLSNERLRERFGIQLAGWEEALGEAMAGMSRDSG
jgi:dTDP-4-dehydrorhamnose reductase